MRKNDAVYVTSVGTIFDKEATVMKFRFTNLKQREKHFAKTPLRKYEISNSRCALTSCISPFSAH